MTALPSNNNTTSTRNFLGYRYNSMVPLDSNGGWAPRFADHRNSSGHQVANAFQFNDNQSSTGTTYSLRPEGHIYEEVGPPSHPPPYFANGEMDGRIASVHQALDHQQHMRGSPSSLCSMCSRRCTGHRGQPSPPTLPICNCVSHGMSQPFCTLHSSISQHTMHTPRPLGHTNSAQQCSPTCNMHSSSPVPTDQIHHGTPCSLHSHPSLAAVTNQRYTAPAGTITPDTAPNNQTEASSKPKDRSLSPFAFLRKNNRDSKASTNTMLDSSSSKSLLMCSRRWLVAIVLTLVLIVVLSVAVGLVVTFTVQDKGEKVTPGVTSPTVVHRVTKTIKASVRVVGGQNAVYNIALGQPESDEFQVYSQSFTFQVNEVLHRRLAHVVDYTRVTGLRNGSVIVDFIVYLKDEYSENKVELYSKDVREEIYLASNRTEPTSFHLHFPVALSSIKAEPLLGSGDVPEQKTTAGSVTVVQTTTTPSPTTVPTTTPQIYTVPPASGVCQPITNPICQQIHYNNSGTTFPNFVGHRNQEEAEVLITVLNALMASTTCYDYLNTFSCALLVPKCGENQSRIPPCRRMCEAAFSSCGVYMKALMEAQGAHTNCSWFPDSTDPSVCVDEQGPVVPTATPTCPTGFFSCDNHTCHEMKDRCDSVSDCKDLGDERECEGFECVPGQFQCANGNCRPKVWRCDGRNDCGDGSDEEGCEPVAPCQHGQFRCANGFNVWNDNAEAENDVCIDSKFTCDNTNDCSDHSDEDSEYCKVNQGR